MKKLWRPLGTLLLIGVLAWRLDGGQVATAFARLDVSLWLAAVGLYLLAQLASSVRWQLLAGPLGLGGPWGRYLAYYFIGMFFNLVLPTSVGGDVVRAWYLARAGGGEPATGRRLGAFLSVFADRANGLVALVAVACVAAACCPVALPGWVTGTVAASGVAAGLGLVVLPLLPRLRPLLPAHPRVERLVDGAALYLAHPRTLVVATVLSVLVQGLNVAVAWLIGRALGLPVPGLYYGVLVPLVALLTLLPLSVNGMGLREAGTAVLLVPLGINPAAAVTLSFLIFAANSLASLPGAVVYLFGRFPRFTADTPERLPAAGVEVRCDEEPVRGDSDQGRARQSSAAA